jgi:transcriptional regulator with XRE-family HTH domain
MGEERNMEPIAKELPRLMAQRGMTVGELWVAADLGGPSGIYRYLKGDRGRGVNSQSAIVLEKISAALDIPPDHWIEYRAYKVREITRVHPALVDEVYDLLVAHAAAEDERQSRRRSSGK